MSLSFIYFRYFCQYAATGNVHLTTDSASAHPPGPRPPSNTTGDSLSHPPGPSLRDRRPCPHSDTIGGSSRLSDRRSDSTQEIVSGEEPELEYNRKEYAIKMKKDFRQSTPQELSAWKKKNASSTTTHLSKAPQNVQDKWKKIKQIYDNCPSKKLDVWVDRTYLYYYYYCCCCFYHYFGS